MKVIKEAEVKVRSVIDNLDSAGLVEGESEAAESLSQGYLHVIDDVTLITYVEEQENIRVTTEIRCQGDCVRIVRSGSIESKMELRVGVAHESLYSVKPYEFDMSVVAKKIRNSLGADGGRLDLIYDMTIGGVKKNVRMKIEVLTK